MESSFNLERIVLLLDDYGREKEKLHRTLVHAGYDVIPIVLQENFFLPEGVYSIYDLMAGAVPGTFSTKWSPIHYNEVPVPDHWTVLSGYAGQTESGEYGQITYLHEEKGRIHYLDSGKIGQRFIVQSVEWFDRRGNVRFADLYSRTGTIVARIHYDSAGKMLQKSWFSQSGAEYLVENGASGERIYRRNGVSRIYKSDLELFAEFLKQSGLYHYRFFYASLALPFLLSNRMPNEIREDVLFWQEPVGDAIPGNMLFIFDDQAARTRRVIVEDSATFERLLALGAPRDKMVSLGNIHAFNRKNKHQSEALICTNSDQLEHIRELLQALPGMHFHIAARTEMSAKLMGLSDYANVSLYPGALPDTFDALFEKCDYYFDINHGSEVLSAVEKAYLKEQLVLAFRETVHEPGYVAERYTYAAKDYAKMAEDVRELMADEALLREGLAEQKSHAGEENPENYRAKLDGDQPEQHVFAAASLRESFGGRLALSWEWTGKADGFLITDADGTILADEPVPQQHYHILPDSCAREGVRVKPYYRVFGERKLLGDSGVITLREKWQGTAEVTVLVPAYNAEEFLPRCMDTILAQTMQEIQVIIVDDGSRDNTPVIADWYAAIYSNVSVIHQENKGIAVTRNVALRALKTPYGAFVDSDDMIRPCMYERLYSAIKTCGCDVSMTSVMRITNRGYEPMMRYPLEENTGICLDDFFRMHWEKSYPFYNVVWNKIYRTSLLQEHLFPEITAEDESWIPYVLSFAEKICYRNDLAYEYDRIIRPNTLVDTWYEKSEEERYAMHEEAILFYLTRGNPDRRELLKQVARLQLTDLGMAYHHPGYAQLLERIEDF